MPKEIRGGTCYEDSFKFVFDHGMRGRQSKSLSDIEGPFLVHGTVYSPYYGRRIKHAWVEFPESGYVMDAASGQLFDPVTWKKISKARRLHVYTPV